MIKGHAYMNIRSLATYCPAILQPAFDKITNSPIGLRLARGFFWSIVGTILSRGLMFIASILIARILGKTGYGEFGIIQSTVGMFGVFAGFGLGLTATKHVAQYKNNEPDRAGRIIGLSWFTAIATSGIIALCLIIFSRWLAINTINAPHLASTLRIGALILIFSAFNGTQTGALSGFEAFKTIAHVNLFVGLISFPVLVAGAYWGGLTGAIWALVINLFISWLLNHIALRKEAKRYRITINFKNCFQELPILWGFSLPAVLSSSMVGPVYWLCNALLVNQPGGYGEMGIYHAANQWYVALSILPGLLGHVLLPILSERFGQNDVKQSIKTLGVAIKTNAILVIPLALVASLASPYIMSLYGEEFRSGWLTLIVILWTTGLITMQAPVGQVIAASGKMWIGFLMNLGWAIVFISGTLFFVDRGSIGLAIARATAYVFHTIWGFGFVYFFMNKIKDSITSNSTHNTKPTLH